MLVAGLALAGCTYSSNDRSSELASATSTSVPEPSTVAIATATAPPGDGDQGAETPTPGPTNPPPPDWVAIVGVEVALNVRAGPGTDEAVLGQAEKGLTLATTGNKTGAGDEAWIEVVFEGDPGWVFAAYLEAVDTAPTPTPLSTPTPLATPTPILKSGDHVVDAPVGLNLRREPGGEVITEIVTGEVVSPTGATETDDDDVLWVEVEYEGDTGWVAGEFLKPA